MKSRGDRGERIARRVLRWRGYLVLARNVRRQGGEIDLICLRDGVVVFCEVKTRALDGPSAFDAMGLGKRRRILSVGRRWLAESSSRALPCRLALVCVRIGRWPWQTRVTVHDPIADRPPPRRGR